MGHIIFHCNFIINYSFTKSKYLQNYIKSLFLGGQFSEITIKCLCNTSKCLICVQTHECMHYDMTNQCCRVRLLACFCCFPVKLTRNIL